MPLNYHRILVSVDLDDDPAATVSAIRRLAPAAVQTIVLARLPQTIGSLGRQPAPSEDEAAGRALQALQTHAGASGPSLDVAAVSEVTVDALADAVIDAAIDLVVFGSVSMRALALAGELRKRVPVPVLWVRPSIQAPAREEAGGLRLLCVGLSARGRRALIAFLRGHAGPGDRAVLLSLSPLSEDLAALRDAVGLPAGLELVAEAGGSLLKWLDPPVQRGIDLVVLPRFPLVALLGAPAGPAVLILPRLRAPATEWERPIDLPDLVDDGTVSRVRLEYAVGVGRRVPIADQEVAFIGAGTVFACRRSNRGEVELPTGVGPAIGVLRTEAADPPGSSPSSWLTPEKHVAILRGGEQALLLFDAESDEQELASIRAVVWAQPLAVRLRPIRSFESLRARLRAARLAPRVVDAGAVLDEGEGLDVPELVDAVRLARVATRLRCAGFAVAAIVHRGSCEPAMGGCVAVPGVELGALAPPQAAAPRLASIEQRWDAATGSVPIDGNRIEVELDNKTARDWLFSAIEASRRRVHLQVYMALDDDVGRPVEAALAAAASRGVVVRVLVDSLHGLHGSFGALNPLLERLSDRPGVELRVWKPITAVPSIEDLKQRDHRKLLVVDGRTALLGGRNLSHEYYADFRETALSPEMTWRSVPWLDAGARVEGPAVAALERSFLQAWAASGGVPFEVEESAPVGTDRARVVVHRGLRDAHTLETYLAMIETARSHVYVANNFPLLLELQHALLRALRRGVRVRALLGNLTPRHGDQPFQGPFAGARTVATAFVHSRWDPLIAEGAECHEFVVRREPAWDPRLGDLRPHVHAKMMTADGRICAVGSANLDIASAYWESELLLVVEDEAIARMLESRLDQLMASSERMDLEDPEWRERARRRRWMRHWPGMLSG